MSSKKISDLFRLTQLSDDDEFVVVDKSTTGVAPETGLGGRTTKVTFRDLKESVGTSGPQGPRGEIGPQGPVGEKGEKGDIGPIGPSGGSGIEGPRGPIGPKGDTGPQGTRGLIGPKGDQGVQGPPGIAADRGPKGDTGDTGPRGATGSVGPQGPVGDRGPQGPMGQKGDKGDKGEQGPMGPAGKHAENGSPGPSGPQGPAGVKGDPGVDGKNALVNLASDKKWGIGRLSSYADEGTGGSFAPNGGSAENEVVWGTGPFGFRTKVWQARKNDTASNGDGGWNKTIQNVDKNKSYVSVVYVKRSSSSVNGSFYHGCGPYGSTNTLNLSGTVNKNPYFSSFGISGLPENVWCLSIGYIHANNDNTTANTVGGLYRLDTGEKIRNYVDYKMGDTTTQSHRTYLYYSTDPNASLDWSLPGFYEVDSNVPILGQLLGGSGGLSQKAGPMGPSGPIGPKGEKGDKGPSGAQGPRGLTGSSGPQGPKGDTGPSGVGSAPAHAWSGTSLRFIQSNGAWGSYVNLKGATGSAGAKGIKGDKGDKGDRGFDSNRNYTSDRSWQFGKHNFYTADENTGGAFRANGGKNENEVGWGEGPFGHRVKLWMGRGNDSKSDNDGGFDKTITGLDPNKAYIAVVYVRRVSSQTSGSFYHGTEPWGATNTLDLNGRKIENPYFWSGGISTLPHNAWCVSIGYIHANNDTSKSNMAISGLYRLDTGEKLKSYRDFKMGPKTNLGHRTYLFYSTDSRVAIDWCLPGFYEVNSDCPQFRQVLGLAGISGTGGSGGEQGPAGPAGPAGATGATGQKGDKGDKGDKGVTGATGPRGLKGDRGDKGNTGSRGERGLKGDRGPQGVQGQRGDKGDQGKQGIKGDRGNTGPQGPKGDSGVFTGGNISGDAEWQDNKSILLGSSGDYRIYHNSNNHTYFQNRNHGKSTYFQSENSSGTNHAHLYLDGGSRTFVRLFENGSERLRTMDYGIRVQSQVDILSASGKQSGYINNDANGFTRVTGRGAGVGLLDERPGQVWPNQEIARFQDTGVRLRRHVEVSNKWDNTRKLTLTPSKIEIAGHAGKSSKTEGAQINLKYPYDIDTKQTKYAFVDMYYDGGPYLTNYKSGKLRLGFEPISYVGLSISDNGHHTMDGHLYLWDGLNNSVIVQGKAGDSRNQNLVIRHSPTKSTYQDNFRLQRNNGNLGIRGKFVSKMAWGISDINKKKDIEKLKGTESLQKLLELNPVKFNWKDEVTAHKQMGLIAQEVEPILPSVVEEFEDLDESHPIESADCDPLNTEESKCCKKHKSKTISYTELVPVLISAIQEQQQQINELKKQIDSK